MEFNISKETYVRDIAKVQQAFLARVYGWMMLGLLLTALVSALTLQSETLLMMILSNQILFWGLFIAELGLVVFLSARIAKMSAEAAAASFIIYAILNGFTISIILLAYTTASVFATFVSTALMFGAMSLYGYLTKRDLTGLGTFMFMGLVGIIIASVVNVFLHSSAMAWLISFVGIIVFTGLTAYDTQRLKSEAFVMMEGNQIATKGAIMGALQLYLDFVNLFLMLLRFLGDRR